MRILTSPLVTVVVPSFNKAAFVEATLDSIRVQTFQDFELLVIDDCSTDESVLVVETWMTKHGFPCSLVKSDTNRGLCASLNVSLGLAKGSLYACLAADDLWHPRSLELMVGTMRQLPDSVAVLYCDCEEIDEKGRLRSGSSGPPEWYDRAPEGQVFGELFRHGNFLRAGAVLSRTACLRAVGGWDEDLYSEDFDMWLRLAHRYSLSFLPERLLQYRQVSDSMSSSRSGKVRIGRDKVRIGRKWLGMDPETDKLVERWLMSQSVAVEAMYADHDPRARRYALKALRRTPHLRGLLMAVFLFFGLSYSVFCTIDGWRSRLRKLFRPGSRVERSG
jgi:alpha-1,3-rhamnosyltransferase